MKEYNYRNETGCKTFRVIEEVPSLEKGCYIITAMQLVSGQLKKTGMGITEFNSKVKAEIIDAGLATEAELDPPKETKPKKSKEETPAEEPVAEVVEEVIEGISPVGEEVTEPIVEETYIEEDYEGFTTIIISESLPIFSGPEREYNLKKGDLVKMPTMMANALINRSMAIRVNV